MKHNDIIGYYTYDHSFFSVFIDGSVSNGSTGIISEDESYITFPNGKFPIYKSLVSLAASVMHEGEDIPLDDIRADIKHQQSIPDEIDWDYLLDTAARGKVRADLEGRNMTPDFNV